MAQARLLGALLGSLFLCLFLTGAGAPDLLDPQTVEPITASDFHEVLAHHRGKVLLVNLWATWCIPCVRELPELVELQNAYADRGFKVIGVSLDDPEDLVDKVRPFFAERAPGLVSYLQTEERPEDFVNLLDPSWIGVLPTSFVFDRNGELQTILPGRRTYEEFQEAVEPLLEEGSSAPD